MSAYRQPHGAKPILFCPRCNELLDAIDFGVDMCPRCEGFWIGSAVLELSGYQWPAGPKVWWRNELRCPECARTGAISIMSARASGDVIIDHCSEHGVWLDRGELSRVMHDPAISELAKLREHFAALEPTAQQLAERRARWVAERDERARLAEVERKRIDTERAKRAAQAEARERAEHEQERVTQEAKLREAERLARVRNELAQREAEDRAGASQASGDPTQPTEWLERPQPVMLSRPPVRDNALEIARLQRIRDGAGERVAWLEARIDSLEHELFNAQLSLTQARGALAAADRDLEAERTR